MLFRSLQLQLAGLARSSTPEQAAFELAKTRMSGVDCDGHEIRKGAADSVRAYVEAEGGVYSDECDAATAAYLKNEVSDGIIAPAYSDEALAILKTKKGGKYNIVQIDPAYTPAPLEQKDVFGITFEQGHNDCKIDESLLTNIVTENKDLPKGAKRDMLLALITLKYTQSNSVCYVKDGMTIGVGAGQQSRVHCTRLAGNKADIWWLRQNPKVLNLPFRDDVRRPNRDNAIDVYISDDYEDVLADGIWQVRGYDLANMTLVQAIKRIGPTLTSIFGALEPLTAVVIGVAVFGEPFTAQGAAGILLIVAAVSVVVLRTGRRPQ